MSKLISGKEALIALANGEEVEFQEGAKDKWIWMNVKNLTIENILNHTSTYTTHKNPSVVEVNSYSIQFRLKPRTITINNIEVPAPFEPKEGDKVWCISDDHGCGYCMYDWQINHSVVIGAWRTEEEIKQVVSALRSVFKPQ